MGLRPDYPRLLSRLPARLTTGLFANAEQMRLRAGQVLFRASEPGHSCYRVEDGVLKVTIVSGSGGERILAFLGRGAIVGELSIIDGLPRSASVVAVRNAIVSCLSRAAFETFAEKIPSSTNRWSSFLPNACARLIVSSQRVAFFPSKAASHGHYSIWRTISVTKSSRAGSFAAMAGIARENVARILKDWQRRELVSCSSGYYYLENKSQLENQAKL